jgi:hypothetical protein
VTHFGLYGNTIAANHLASIKKLVDRNLRFRRIWLLDARKMLATLMCADECGVVWPYLLAKDDPDNVEAGRRELRGVFAERRRRLHVTEAKRRRLSFIN